jgi:PAS domain S-box-containing protein
MTPPTPPAPEPRPALPDLVRAGLVCYTPVLDAAGQVVDFAFAYVNPAAQRLLGLPAHPAATYRQQFAASSATGAFAFHRDTFGAGGPAQLALDYRAAGFAGAFRLMGQRVGGELLVSFTLAEAPRPAAPAASPAEQLRALLQQVFAQTPAAICVLRGPEHRFDYVNEAYQQFFPGRRLLDLPVVVALPEIEDTSLVALLDRVYQTGETYVGTDMWLPVAPPGGGPLQHRYFTFTYQAYRENGQIAGIFTLAYEVTEQVLARQQRAAQQQQLQTIFEQAPVAIFVSTGPQHVLEVVNPSMGKLLHLDPAELLGKPYAEAVPEIAAQGYLELLDEVWRTGETLAVHERPTRRTRHQPGQTGYYTFMYQPLRDAQQQLTGIICVVQDVTEQVQARQAVEAGAQRLQLLTDALPVLIAYLDLTPTYQFVNQAYQAWFGRSPAELVGRSPRELVGEAAFAQVSSYLARVLAGERVDYEATMPYRPDFTRHIHGSLIPNLRQGVVVGYYSLIYDVTDLVAARHGAEASTQQALALADALRQANEQLTRTNVDLDNFIYTASHDLRAPIANIEGLLLAVQQELPAAGRVGQIPTMLGLMQGAVERFGRTIGHLTDISRLQQEYARPATTVNLATVLREVQLDLAPLLRETGGQLAVTVPEETTLLFSAKNLRSVLYNLLSNALKYRHPSRAPQVHVAYREQAPYQMLEVRDNGLGLDLTRGEEKLFGMFQRLHAHVEGTGVGLYMVKRMVENAGGHIEVQSQLGQGSTFSVYLPSATSQE